MLTYPSIDPVLFSIGPLAVHWYGAMYLVGFVGGWWLGRVRAAKPDSGWTPQQVDDLLFYITLGVVLGGRLGYVLFYGFADLQRDPLSILRIWQGGMSFHGGLIGVLIAMWLFGRRHQKGFFQATDFIAPLIPIGLGAGRIGNFINGELWGGPGSVPWAMQVSCERFVALCQDKLQLPTGTLMSPPLHPNQLYEALLEGVVMFLILWIYSAKPRPAMAVSGLFLICYGVFRFAIEFVRMPDAHLGYLAFDWLTMGQILTLPMLLSGVVLIGLAFRNRTQTG
ncbi:prolipoprotein diacylglyceryl transferase [Sedimenticola selenatireducens]|uniref:Phosphatidylglycerol--prolipoprotein diacylglyceryl transferase n=1 Tax=Sedimenticola selenatireducens TaxID=191960 RepID=A0A557SGS3_9GAMM|nr:prolipoprotein diacylglyceryl transferase [Sedimenticola selenatireducens]TVO76617.1 prolipoprotein diacylglyceryl transferase [Sedimenticola selenatireducens]TVT64060.1 MAG: prolipoprotein diacylglyceryl transferase [Sedimenticola selenatireducens]